MHAKISKDCAEPRSTIPKMKEEKGMMHARIYPGHAALTVKGSPYDGVKVAPSAHMPMGRAQREASKDPLAIRTSGFP